ncbi:MFS transporter [Brevibacillus borstelensis]|uniref:MFS transporter n=1 Tax=Brevibacillus borstelensis TaxID=45462 RepID=UPI000F08745D|nr:MFS transporter [Brevibacillus borstelensis]MED1881795.1 MFS transporter [Brevibacillus borstelensis]RNB63031.1 MFS transporter [Brevibacillus borstelensis]GED53313.1 putative MFS-type transporter YitG [Brevibacillus borstelensis]
MAQNTKNLVGLTGIPLVMVLGNSMLIPVLPTMKSKMDLTALQTSLLITAFSISAGIVIPLAGYLSDRFGRKIVIILSLILYGAGGLVAGLASLWWDNPYMLIMLGRVMQGVGAAGTAPIAMAMAGDLFKGASESRALGLMETSNGLGKVLSPVFGSLLAMIAWYMVFLAFPIICGVVLLLFLFFTKEKKQEKQPMPVRQYLQSIGQVFRQHGRWLIPAFFIGSICLFTLFGVLFYLSDLLEEKYKIDGLLKGAFLAVPLLVMSITAYITGLIIKKKLGLMRLFVIIGMFLLATSYVIANFVKGAYVLTGVLIIGSVGTGLILPCLNSMIIGAVKKSERGMITSLYSGVRFIGVAVGPPVFTWLLDRSRSVMFLSIAGLAALFGVVAIFFLKPKQAGDAASEQPSEEEEESAKETKAMEQVAEILGIHRESEEDKRRVEAIKRFGFDPNDLMDALLKNKGTKNKEKG